MEGTYVHRKNFVVVKSQQTAHGYKKNMKEGKNKIKEIKKERKEM